VPLDSLMCCAAAPSTETSFLGAASAVRASSLSSLVVIVMMSQAVRVPSSGTRSPARAASPAPLQPQPPAVNVEESEFTSVSKAFSVLIK